MSHNSQCLWKKVEFLSFHLGEKYTTTLLLFTLEWYKYVAFGQPK